MSRRPVPQRALHGAVRGAARAPRPSPAMSQDRRSFLAMLGAAAAGCVAGQPGAAASMLESAVAPQPAPRRIGVQLYTVRTLAERDLPGTLQRIAEIGYRDVEFAGYYGRSPAEIRALLTRYDLGAPSSHIPIASLRGDWKQALDEAKTIGHEFVTIPWLGNADRASVDSWKRVAELFNRGGAEARAAGLRFAYHNHDFEFRRIGDVVPFDLLLAGTDPELVSFQMDIYWLVRAGHDPLAYLARHPGRFTMVHAKDSAGPPEHRMVDVGVGRIDFATLLPRAVTAGVKHVFVEHDQPADPMASIATSYQHLARLPF